MVSRMNVKALVVLALTLMALAGCARREPGPVAKPVVGKAIAIPAKNVQFRLLPPRKEKRSGLYACSPYDTYWKFTIPWLFSSCADGKSGKPGGAAYRPTAGKRIWLVGKLPWAVREEDFFKPEAGRITGVVPERYRAMVVGGLGAGGIEIRKTVPEYQPARIDVPVKYVRYAGPVKRELADRAVYFSVNLPSLPAGKYRATVRFKDYVYTGNRNKIHSPKVSSVVAPRFKPLVCEFEVKAAGAKKKPAAKVSWGKPVKGLRAGLAPLPRGKLFPEAVHLHNTTAKPLRVFGLTWQFTYTTASGRALVARPVCKAKPSPPPRPLVIPAGGKVRLKLNYADANYERGRFLDTAKPRQKWAEMLKSLPAGRYGLTLTCEHRAGHPQEEACSLLHGKLVAGPVAVEFTPVEVEVDAVGRLSLDGKKISAEKLQKELVARGQKHLTPQGLSDLRLVIRAEAKTPYSAVQRVMLLCMTARIWRVSFAVAEHKPALKSFPKDTGPAKTKTGLAKKRPVKVVIHVRRDGKKPEFRVGTWKTASHTKLLAYLKRLQGTVEVSAVVNSARDCPFRHVMQALDACARAGIVRLEFRPPEGLDED